MNTSPRRARLKTTGQVLFYVMMAAGLVAFLILGVLATIDLSKPVEWGTFTQEDCLPRSRGGCQSVGPWIGDRGGSLARAYLNGSVDSNGTVRAAYRADANLGSESEPRVDTAFWLNAGPFVTFGGFLVLAGITLRKAFEWDHLYLVWRWWQRRHPPRPGDPARGLA